jgi:hypothetical protein
MIHRYPCVLWSFKIYGTTSDKNQARCSCRQRNGTSGDTERVRQDSTSLSGTEAAMSVDVKIEQQLRICIGTSDARLSTMTWREYHESTQHSVESLRQALHVLDWANMPDSFRHYEGVPVLDLPADPPSPDIPALEVLHGVSGILHSSILGTPLFNAWF